MSTSTSTSTSTVPRTIELSDIIVLPVNSVQRTDRTVRTGMTVLIVDLVYGIVPYLQLPVLDYGNYQ